MRVGVLTGGGDAPGLNAAIRAVGQAAWREGYEVVGIRNGWLGLLQDDVFLLSPETVADILPRAGTILGTSRTNPFKTAEGARRIQDTLRTRGIDVLVAIGGDDTLGGPAQTGAMGGRVLGIPQTKDKQIPGNDYTHRFDNPRTTPMCAWAASAPSWPRKLRPARAMRRGSRCWDTSSGVGRRPFSTGFWQRGLVSPRST